MLPMQESEDLALIDATLQYDLCAYLQDLYFGMDSGCP